ncbi:MAG: transcriptional regulator [Planctomycetes bacterium HGW-Planctomycetes-1]|nr:MAG: transcriptional regulator [Planctomycetes bacterium HGW-Planctomycetes-1]
MIKQKKPNCKRFNILFTCIGRRVPLLNSFKKAAKELKLDCRFFATETTTLSSALQLCDKKFIVPPTNHKSYIKRLLKIVKQTNVKLLIPTIDLDLQILADNREKFAAAGCTVLISKPNVVKICQDKRKTFKFLVKNGFDTPNTLTRRQLLGRKNLGYPCFLKPWDGHASKGTIKVKNREELAFYTKKIPKCIIQEFIQGQEITCDIYIDLNLQVRCVVPRKRIETRAGEVSKGTIVKNKTVMNKVAELVKCLGAGPGVVTVQLILSKDKKMKFIEINPRFGGGAPLSIKAGADFPKWILAELIGKKPQIKSSGFKDKLTMLRYDAEVWV